MLMLDIMLKTYFSSWLFKLFKYDYLDKGVGANEKNQFYPYEFAERDDQELELELEFELELGVE